MNEADVGGNLPVVLFWLWWALLTVLNLISVRSSLEERSETGRGTAEETETDTVGIDPVCREKIHQIDPAFDEKHFLEGALKAYEIILEAYAAGDLGTLRPLLDDNVFGAFERAIAGRMDRRETTSITFIGIENAHIVGVVAVEGGMAISVRFVAEMVRVTHLADGTVLEGDPQGVIETNDLWTFEPDPASAGRSWRVTATDGA